jgi:hypothetical protein
MTRPVGKKWLAGSVGLLLLAAAPARALSAHHNAPSIMALVPATKTVVFHPRGVQGKPLAGSCAMGESLALPRADAWRCIVGNIIYDPCFSTTPHATAVICDASPFKPIGIRVQLPTPLPTHPPVNGQQVWMMQLGNGVICGFLTGATAGIQGQRINYGCTDKTVVLGNPHPDQAKRICYAVEAQLSTKPSPAGPTARRIFAISIATVWR